MSLIQKIYDSVHRFIHIDPIESALIYSPPFQRLLYINQLGVTFFVYPGATHRRFEHSLGVMELSSAIYDQITKEAALVSFPGAAQKVLSLSLPSPNSSEHIYWKKILRLSSLCHDLGHLPFSHVAEKALLGEEGHEGWTGNLNRRLFWF
ncbi:MAG: HD domain-containing protein [Simkania negevensis]|nr:HD domain-containing protein [Simkania negevensis]